MVVAFDEAAVRALATILSDTGLTEIEVESKDGRIRVARAAAVVQHVAAEVAAPLAAAQAAAPSAAAAAASAQAAATSAADQEKELWRHPAAVLSPMVGVAYLAPEPGATPFITPGQVVAAGQTLLLIEAMKTFNQIKAPRAGTVTRILVGPASPVEYGEALLLLE
jgi:acetyl-CoA carboxylase biotin carboxyl carrier protein